MCKRIGMIDLDNKFNKHPFPNLPLMKLSAWHKAQGDDVSWYDGTHYDLVYVSKVFSFTPDYDGEIDADEIKFGGSGFAIHLEDGKEIYDKSKDPSLPYEIEHIYPDYDLYGITDVAYGFMSRGCPRGCDFCHVKDMQGTVPHKVADLSEFWNGQKRIVLLDPNITAFIGWKEVFQQLIDSKAEIDFCQGLDIRCMTREKAEMLKQMKVKYVHFAWDRYEDKKWIIPKLKEFVEVTGWNKQIITVYILCNFDTTFEQDIERIMTIREMNLTPYVMLYDKEHIKRGSDYNKLSRWVNWKRFFWKIPTFEEYKRLYAEGVLK